MFTPNVIIVSVKRGALDFFNDSALGQDAATKSQAMSEGIRSDSASAPRLRRRQKHHASMPESTEE